MFRKSINIDSIFVSQGNGNGRRIKREAIATSMLKTEDLIGCIAILITDKNYCYLIHSDTNNDKGIGSINLEKALNHLGVEKDGKYQIGLIGGVSTSACSDKKIYLQKLLPFATINTCGMGDSAYILSDGFMAGLKKEIREHFNASEIIEHRINTDPNNLSKKMI